MDREDLERRIVGIKKDALGQVVASLPEEVRKRAIAEIEKTATQDVATWVEVRPLREPFVAPAAEPTTLARASAEP